MCTGIRMSVVRKGSSRLIVSIYAESLSLMILYQDDFCPCPANNDNGMSAGGILDEYKELSCWNGSGGKEVTPPSVAFVPRQQAVGATGQIIGRRFARSPAPAYVKLDGLVFLETTSIRD